jgi:hypothetical protein
MGAVGVHVLVLGRSVGLHGCLVGFWWVGARCYELVLVGDDDCLGSVVYLKSHDDAADVGLDGGNGEVQPCGDVVVGEAVGHEGEDFALAWG